MSHRLPSGTRLGAVRLQVADLSRSIDYYERVIGLQVAERRDDKAMLTDHGGGAIVELHERAGAVPVPRRGRLGLYHFAILVPERAALGRFVTHLAERNIHAGMSDHLVSEAVYLTDPDGLGIEVYADRPRNEWRRESGQLVMATDPLDVSSLVASAGGEPWTGMPDGTVIGHVHLHVGDIESAAAFYDGGLGFDRTVWSYPGALFLSAGGYHHHLGTNTWARGAAPAGAADARLLEWTIDVPDATAVGAVEASLKGRGYAVERSGSDVVTSDPWGTRVRVTTQGT